MRLAIAAAMLLLTLRAAPARADECIQGWVADLDVPRDGSTVRPGSHFRVLDYWGCSSVSGGPRNEFRLRTSGGAEIPFKAIPWAERFIELAPETQVAAGEIDIDVRRPFDKDTLGPWQRLARVKVAGAPDAAAPAFEGLLDGDASALEGSVMLSPCQAVPGWQLETRIRFKAASDPGSHHDELLYLLERTAARSAAQDKEGRWERVTTLRPTPKDGLMTFSWKAERGWGEAWVYRMSARDMAGNETAGLKTISIKNPERPARELWSPEDDGREASSDAPSSVSPTSQSRCVCSATLTGGDRGRSSGAAHIALFLFIAGCAALRLSRVRRPSAPPPRHIGVL